MQVSFLYLVAGVKLGRKCALRICLTGQKVFLFGWDRFGISGFHTHPDIWGPVETIARKTKTGGSWFWINRDHYDPLYEPLLTTDLQACAWLVFPEFFVYPTILAFSLDDQPQNVGSRSVWKLLGGAVGVITGYNLGDSKPYKLGGSPPVILCPKYRHGIFANHHCKITGIQEITDTLSWYILGQHFLINGTYPYPNSPNIPIFRERKLHGSLDPGAIQRRPVPMRSSWGSSILRMLMV